MALLLSVPVPPPIRGSLAPMASPTKRVPPFPMLAKDYNATRGGQQAVSGLVRSFVPIIWE